MTLRSAGLIERSQISELRFPGMNGSVMRGSCRVSSRYNLGQG